ncbi:MAG: tetratricopeptide repeat protein [Desulfobacterales bacterium]|jgi:adenylate cyclase
MTETSLDRKLRAIFSADVKGYSRLMGEDEEYTVKTITAYRELIFGIISKYKGRVVDSPGDNILAEFSSAVNVVKSSVEIQETLKEKNADLPDSRKMEFRIGINLGEIIQEDDRIYGDGVNVSARIEGLAEPNGVCISRSVYDQVKKKLTNLGYEYIGAHDVKNISEPVRVYKVLMEPEHAGKVIGEKTPKPSWPRTATATLVVLAIAACSLAIWNLYIRRPTIEPASIEKMAFPLPDKPSIAVLPFDNLSGDSQQDYFSDGITESIITALSNVSNLFVIARNSTFTYKGKPVKVQQVAQELGVRYVLEGSVQRSGDQVRITAQLNDALKGHHLWAEKYDRKIGEIFALQDDITDRVATALEVKLTEGEQARIRRGKTDNPKAYEYFLRGLEIGRRFTKEDNAQARKLFEKAVEIDPNFAYAWQEIGRMHYRDARFGWTDSPAESLKLAEELAKKTLTFNDSDATAYATLSLVYMARRQHEKAVVYGEKALELAPNFADVNVMIALPFYYSGRPRGAIELVKKAMRLSPYYPDWYLPVLGHAYRLTGQYKEAIDALESWRERANPRSELPYLMLAFTYAEAGREEDANRAVEELLKRKPKASIEGYAKSKFFAYKDPAEIKRALESLRKAGLPESPPLPLPDKPSIAVLPFDNLSGDPDQEYLSDGISETIISSLSKIPKMFVIARNSTFTYKGKPVKVQQVSRELGVRYVLEGSVQKAGDQLRITAQLVDATTGNHLWSERYDRELKDIFALQDDITKNIITAMQIKLTEGEEVRSAAKGTNNLGAYLKYLQARNYIQELNPESNALAKQLAEEAIALDPNYAWAYYILGRAHMVDVWLSSNKSPKDSIAKSRELAKKAIALDNSLAEAYALLGYLFTMTGQHDEAIAQVEKAVALDPSSADLHYRLGKVFIFVGRWEESISEYKKAIRLDPIPPNMYLWSLGYAYARTGQYDEATKWCEKAVHQQPDDIFARIMMASVYSFSGRDEEAQIQAAEVLRLNPKFSLEEYAKKIKYKNQDDQNRVIEALQKAGLK